MVKLEEFVPTFIWFTCHWKTGLLPSFVVWEVKVTGEPAQIPFAEGVITISVDIVPDIVTSTWFETVVHPPLLVTVTV